MKLVFIIFCMLHLSGNMANAQISDLKTDKDNIVTDSLPAFPSISVNRFDSLLREKNIQLVDVRTAKEYMEGALPDAINIDVLSETFNSKVDSLLDKQLPVAVYCRSGVRSKAAAAKLVEKGFVVYNLDKGFNAWKTDKKEVYFPIK